VKNNNNLARFQFLFIVIFSLSFVTSANAALYSRLNGQAVYDSDLNVTWLADANLAASETFGVAGVGSVAPGMMSWYTAPTWIQALNTADYLGFSDWRMPTTLFPDSSCGLQSNVNGAYNCTGSEMGHLFYTELGGTAGNSILTSGDPDLALFHNIQVDFPYLSSTINAPGSTGVWVFGFDNGNEFGNLQSAPEYVWVVRTGDVAAVPVPAALWLFGSGLIGILGFMRRGQRK